VKLSAKKKKKNLRNSKSKRQPPIITRTGKCIIPSGIRKVRFVYVYPPFALYVYAMRCKSSQHQADGRAIAGDWVTLPMAHT